MLVPHSSQGQGWPQASEGEHREGTCPAEAEAGAAASRDPYTDGSRQLSRESPLHSHGNHDGAGADAGTAVSAPSHVLSAAHAAAYGTVHVAAHAAVHVASHAPAYSTTSSTTAAATANGPNSTEQSLYVADGQRCAWIIGGERLANLGSHDIIYFGTNRLLLLSYIPFSPFVYFLLPPTAKYDR